MSDAELERFEHYTGVLKLGNEVANTLARDEQLSRFFKEALQIHDSAVNIANIVANEVARELKKVESEALVCTPAQVAQLVKMIDEELISTKIAKQVFEEMVSSGKEPAEIVKAKGLIQISDPAEILPIIDKVIAENPDNLEKYRAGNSRLMGFFVGQVLKATGGKANPKVVNQLVKERLG